MYEDAIEAMVTRAMKIGRFFVIANVIPITPMVNRTWRYSRFSKALLKSSAKVGFGLTSNQTQMGIEVYL